MITATQAKPRSTVTMQSASFLLRHPKFLSLEAFGLGKIQVDCMNWPEPGYALLGNKWGSEMSEMEEAGMDLATILAQFTNYIMNERVRAYNEGVDAERERCACIAQDFPYQVLHIWERPGGPPGNGYRDTRHEDIADAIRNPSQVRE